MSAADGRVQELFTQLGITIDPQLYRLALTHRSWAFEHGGAPHNERLEFLGDAVLGVVVTEHLYRSFPDKPEGWLAKMRAAVVNTYALADVARGLALGQVLLLGKGERQTGGTDKDSILADATEAMIAAVFLSCGREAASRFVHALMDPVVEAASTDGRATDWKTALQELAAHLGLTSPVRPYGFGPRSQSSLRSARRRRGRYLRPLCRALQEVGRARGCRTGASPVDPAGAPERAPPCRRCLRSRLFVGGSLTW